MLLFWSGCWSDENEPLIIVSTQNRIMRTDGRSARRIVYRLGRASSHFTLCSRLSGTLQSIGSIIAWRQI
jgi:hypothetical protein